MLLEIVLFSIPEALVVSWLVHILSGSRLCCPKLVAIGVLAGIVSNFLRPYMMGIYVLNMLMYAALLIVLFIVFKAASAWKLVVSVAFAMPLYLLMEFMCILFIIIVFNVTPSDFVDNLPLKFLCFLPQLSATTLLALAFIKFNINLFNDHPRNKEV